MAMMVIIAVATFNFQLSAKVSSFSDLALANVEALAGNERDPWNGCGFCKTKTTPISSGCIIGSIYECVNGEETSCDKGMHWVNTCSGAGEDWGRDVMTNYCGHGK